MNPRERLMLVIGVILLGLVVWKYMIHDPQAAQYQSLVAARDQARDELLRDQQILAREAQVRGEFQRLRAFVQVMEAKLPSQKELPPLLTAMEQYTRRLGLGLDSFRPSNLVAIGETSSQGKPAAGQAATTARGGGRSLPYSKMDVGMNLTGTFAQIMTYLRDLGGLPRLVIVNGVTLTPEKTPRLTFTVQSEIYVVTTPAAARK